MENEIDNYPNLYLKMIYKAGRNCYGAREACDTDKKMAKFAKMLISRGHESVLEHICVSIYAKDVSRSFLAQLTRHRLVSYSVKSQHYVKHSNFKYKPLEEWGDETWRTINKSKYEDLMLKIAVLYDDLVASGIPHYIAREVLPNSCLTDMYITANVREWRHIIKMRVTKNNTPEIQKWAENLLVKFYLRMPELFEDLYKTYILKEEA